MCRLHNHRRESHGDPLTARRRVRRASCAVDGCTGPVQTRGWCNTHYRRWQRHGDPLVLLRHVGRACSVAGCARRTDARGMCNLHYVRQKRAEHRAYLAEQEARAQAVLALVRDHPDSPAAKAVMERVDRWRELLGLDP